MAGKAADVQARRLAVVVQSGCAGWYFQHTGSPTLDKAATSSHMIEPE
jgi:hypothetical protein